MRLKLIDLDKIEVELREERRRLRSLRTFGGELDIADIMEVLHVHVGRERS